MPLSRDSTFGLPFRHKPVSPSVSNHAPVLIWITPARMSSEITATHKDEPRSLYILIIVCCSIPRAPASSGQRPVIKLAMKFIFRLVGNQVNLAFIGPAQPFHGFYPAWVARTIVIAKTGNSFRINLNLAARRMKFVGFWASPPNHFFAWHCP